MKIRSFSTDDHATAPPIISGAALLNALDVVGKTSPKSRLGHQRRRCFRCSDLPEHYIRLGVKAREILLSATPRVWSYKGVPEGIESLTRRRFATRIPNCAPWPRAMGRHRYVPRTHRPVRWGRARDNGALPWLPVHRHRHGESRIQRLFYEDARAAAKDVIMCTGPFRLSEQMR